MTHRCPHISCQLIFFLPFSLFIILPLCLTGVNCFWQAMQAHTRWWWEMKSNLWMGGLKERDLGFLGEGLGQQRKLLQGQSHLVLFWPPGTLCACVCACVCYCITTIASMSLSSSDRVFCRWEDFLLYFWQWLNRSKQVCLCLCFSLTFLQKCRTEITKKRSGLLF